MSRPTQLKGLSEVKNTLLVDGSGRLVSADPPNAGASNEAAALAAALDAFGTAGGAAKLGPITGLVVKARARSTVTAVRADGLLHVGVDPATTTNQVERAVREWQAAPASAPRRPTPPRPVPVPAAAAAPDAPAKGTAADPWAAFRKALGRGQLQEGVAQKQRLGADADAGRAGSEPIEGDGIERGVRALLEGIGSTLAGDGVGGARILEPLARATQPNLSFRWLAQLWSARAAMRSGSVPAARAHVQEALTAARQLDVEARALSQWIAAEVLAQDGDPGRALAWLAESRSRFEKVGDRWGMGQTWLAEARVLTSTKREKEASEAAQAASALDPDSEEPHVVLARLALIRDDLAAAEVILLPLKTQAAERLRALLAAVRGGLVSRPAASEFLREQDAPPSERAFRALERIANASPRFAPAREALGWMLLRLGRYEEAGAVFRGLLALALPPADRASVMLGLGCIPGPPGGGAPAQLREVVAAGAAPAKGGAPDALPPLPALSTSAMLSRGPQGAGASAVFSGQLSSFALPDLLEFLRSGKRSGLLVCSSASGMGALRFRDGWVTGAASPSTPGIGQVLVLSRKIKPEALSQVSAALGDDQADPLVAERLVHDGLADAATVKAGYERQIRFAVRELMLWTDGEFTFNREPEGAPESPALAVSLDPQGLLLNFFKEMDEASRSAPSP